MAASSATTSSARSVRVRAGTRRTTLTALPVRGLVPGRRFRLTLALDASARRLRVEVSDARGDLRPHRLPADADPLPTGGRGPTLVTALADHWDCVPYPPHGKTVRAELLDTGA